MNKKCTYTKGTVTDIVTNEPVKASVELFNLRTDRREQKVTSDSVNGNYLVVLRDGSEYGVHVDSCKLIKSIYD